MKIHPSVMAKSQKELDVLLEKYKLFKELHLDVVDGKFAKNQSLNFNFKLPKGKFNAHLMVKNPVGWIKKYGSKVNLCIVQWGEIAFPDEFIAWMRSLGKKVAFALKPEDKVSDIKSYLKKIDYVLVLTVNPGFYGSKYLKKPLGKIKEIKKVNPRIKVIVDGGMNPKTVKSAVKAGADIVIVGSYLAESKDVGKAMEELG